VLTMSVQSVVSKTPQEIMNKVDDYYKCLGDKLILKYDYDIDRDIDKDKFARIEWLDRIVSSCSVDWVRALNKLKKEVE